MKRFLLLLLLLHPAVSSMGQLTFDANTGTTGVQNGAGVWDATTENWWNGTTNVAWDSGIAQFGVNTSAVGGTVTINSNISATGLNFLPLSAAPTTSNQAYHFTTTAAGTLNLTGVAPVINIGNASTSGASTAVTAVNFLLPVTASNLTIQKSSGTSLGFVRFAAVNPGLTGLLTLKGNDGGIFLGFGNTSFPNLTAVVVEPTSVAQLTGTNAIYTTPFRISGAGSSDWGAIRMDASVTLAGGVTLLGDARVHTHTNVINSFITAPITESGGSYSFIRTALLPTTATGELLMTYTAANTFTGATAFGRAVTPAFPTAPASSEGGVNLLDFSATGAPTDDIFYNGVTKGQLNLFGGHATTTVMRLRGKDSTVNSQTFGTVQVAQNRSEIEVISGSNGSMNLALGDITRLGTGVLSIKQPVNGSITTTATRAFLGAWVTWTATNGSSSWAGQSGGSINAFLGDTPFSTGTVLADAPTANLQVGIDSTGPVSQGPGTTTLNSVSMTDVLVDRSLNVGAGQTLRLGVNGGIQVVTGARGLSVNAGTLTGGGADNTAGQVILTNFSNQRLSINSVIANNGSGAVSVILNGTGTSVLSGANTYTGQTVVNSGSLEATHSSALGTTAGNTQVISGASLLLSGGITTGEQIVISGRGVDLAGALRNVSGTNTLTNAVVALTQSRIQSDAGEFIITPTGGLTANAISAPTLPLTFTGAGNITINGRVNTTTSTSAITKDGAGILTLAGSNTFAGTVTASAGTLRISHNDALGTTGTGAGTTIASGATLELTGGITTPEAMNVSGLGVGGQGVLRNISGSNTMAGQVTLGASTVRIQAETGTTLNFDVATGNAILHSGTAAVIATFAGGGTIILVDPIAKSSTGTLGMTKTGNGITHVRAASPTLDAMITANGGILNLDYSANTATTNLIGVATVPLTFSGGVLQVTGRSGATVKQTFGAVTMAIGTSELRAVQNGGTAVNLGLGVITRAVAGSLLQITPAATGTLTTTGGANNAVMMNDNIPFATMGLSDWAATDLAVDGVRNIVGLSTLTGGYTATTGGTLSGHADMTTAAVSVANDQTISSLRFNTPTASTVTVATGKILSLGGILVGADAGAFESRITGGTIRSSSTSASNTNADFVVIQNNTAAGLTIASIIANNATASSVTAFTKAGPGTVYLEGVNHTYAGTTRVMNGTLHVRSGTISASSEVTLGSGSNSGVLKLGSGSTAVSVAVDWLRIDGTGTGNALVGGATAYSTFSLDNTTVASDFRAGMIGGTGENEDNLNFRLTAGGDLVATLGLANTYKGKTTMLAGVLEATFLANAGMPSSIGRGDQNAESAIIDMSGATVTGSTVQATSTLRYIGSVDSVTDRAIRVTNADVIGDTFSVIATVENTGTGTVKFNSPFTSAGSNTAPRTLRLGGTQTGANEIVGIGDAPAALTTVEKTGVGTWIITGDSAHTGGTIVSNGVLQLGNGGSTGSVAGTSISLAATTAILSTNRSDTLTLTQSLTGTGSLRIDNIVTGVTRLTSDANTYGGTLVQSGTLLANNASAASSATGLGSVRVNPGATLGGTGRIAPGADGSITIIGGLLSVGDSTLGLPTAADLTLATSGTGLLSLQAASVFAFDLFSGAGAGDNTASGTAADMAVIFGAVTMGTDITLRVSNATGMTEFAENDSWKLFDWSGLSGPVSGSFTHFDLPTLSSGLTWDLSNLYSQGVISIMVPEPSRLLLMMIGLAFGILRRRRR